MAQLATKTSTRRRPRRLSAIDRGQLSRMTFGDRSLEREVLQLFDRQADLLLARMRGAEPAAVGDARAYAERLGGEHRRERRGTAAAAVERAAGTADARAPIGRLADGHRGGLRGDRRLLARGSKG